MKQMINSLIAFALIIADLLIRKKMCRVVDVEKWKLQKLSNKKCCQHKDSIQQYQQLKHTKKLRSNNRKTLQKNNIKFTQQLSSKCNTQKWENNYVMDNFACQLQDGAS